MLIQSDFIDLDTPTGVMRTYIHRPNSNGQFPVILFYSEIFQQTGPIERAAKIIASHGYAVLVPEVFHELNPIGTILEYDNAGREKGRAQQEPPVLRLLLQCRPALQVLHVGRGQP